MGLGGCEHAGSLIHHVVLGEALSDRLALGQQKGVGHAPAEDEHVDLRHQVVEDVQLAGYLGSADNRGKGPRWRFQQIRQLGNLLLHEEPGVGRQELGNPHGRGVGAMRRPERVVHVDVGVGRELCSKCGVVLLLLGVESEVLEQNEFAGPQTLDRVDRTDPKCVAGDGDVLADQLGQALGCRSQTQPIVDLAVGSSEMACQDDLRAVRQEMSNRRKRGPDPGVVRDLPVLERYVEIDAQEDAFACDIDVADGQFVHDVPARRRAELSAGAAPRRTRRRQTVTRWRRPGAWSRPSR